MTAAPSYCASLLILLALSSVHFSEVRSLIVRSVSRQWNDYRSKISMSSVYASASDDIKGLVSRAEMILIVPISTVRTEYISGNSTHCSCWCFCVLHHITLLNDYMGFDLTIVFMSSTLDLKKILPRKLEATMVPASKLTQAVDGTAFCQLGKLWNFMNRRSAQLSKWYSKLVSSELI